MSFVADAKQNLSEGFDKAKEKAQEAGDFVRDKVDDVTGHHHDDAAAARSAGGEGV
jgi:hypothetical protein